MKKYLFLFLVLSTQLMAQWIPQGDGYTYTFDIKYGGVAAIKDSVEWIDMDMQYGDLAEIWIKGNANSSVDSIYLRSGAKVFTSSSFIPTDTVWGSLISLEDSTRGTNIFTIVNQTTGKHFFLYEPILDVIEFGLLNYRGALITRSVDITIKTKKTTQ